MFFMFLLGVLVGAALMLFAVLYGASREDM